MNTARQYEHAEYLSTILILLGLVFIGAGVGYWLSFQNLAEACGTLITAPELCKPTLKQLSKGVQWCLIAGVVSMASGGGMNYALRKLSL